MIIFSFYNYGTEMDKFVRFIKYCNQDNYVDQGLVREIKQEFWHYKEMKLPLQYDIMIAQELNKYYKEQIWRAHNQSKDAKTIKFSSDSHRLLGYLVQRYAQKEDFDKQKSMYRMVNTCFQPIYCLWYYFAPYQ